MVGAPAVLFAEFSVDLQLASDKAAIAARTSAAWLVRMVMDSSPPKGRRPAKTAGRQAKLA
jgi:hypothetical protein